MIYHIICFTVIYRRGESFKDSEFLNEKNPALQDFVRRLPPILTDFKIKSADLVLNQTHIKVIFIIHTNFVFHILI